MTKPGDAEANRLQRLSSACNRLTELALVPIVVIFIVIVFVSVLTRYVFNYPMIYSVELARLAFIWTMLLAIAIGVYRGAHVAIYNLRDCLPRAWRDRVAVLVHLASAGFGALMVWYGVQLAIRVWPTSFPTLGWSQGWLYLPLAISGALIAVHGLAHAATHRGGDPEEGVKP
jgi:TRAP-type C4-dicarboxylate transport system permease small subunit